MLRSADTRTATAAGRAEQILVAVGAVARGDQDADLVASRPDLVVTPVGVVVELQPAGLPSRLAAYAVDLVVASIVSWVILAVAAQAAILLRSATVVAIASAIVGGLSIIGYPIVAESLWNGRTLGKLLTGLRVVTVDGAPIRPRHAAVRGIMLLVEVASFGLLAVVSTLLSGRGRRLGDLAAGTIVVRDRAESSFAGRPLHFAPPPGWEALAATFDTGAIDEATYALLRQVVLRGPSLTRAAREDLTARLATVVARRIGLPAPPVEASSPFLVAVLAAYQRRPGHGPLAPVSGPVGGPPGLGARPAAGVGPGVVGPSR